MADLLERGADGKSAELVDEILAEILDLDAAVADLFGTADLGERLIVMADLLRARHRGGCGVNPALERLNGLLAAHPMFHCRAELIERVANVLRGLQPLTRAGRAADRRALLAIVTALTAPAGLRGGRAMSEAVTRRARLVFGEDQRDLTAAEGVKAVLKHLLVGAPALWATSSICERVHSA